MEGPLLRIITENLVELKGKKVVSASGNAKIEIEVVEGKKIEDVFCRGKNLFMKFSDFSIKLHFLMAGSYTLNEEKEGVNPRISLVFEDGMFNFYGGTVKIISNNNVEGLYDEEVDITSDNWNLEKVLSLASKKNKKLICDVLLDQNIFAGVGNIIKNEALFMAKIHPLSIVGKIPKQKLKELVLKTRKFSMLFYEAIKKGKKFGSYFNIYGKEQCSNNKDKVIRQTTGKKKRISFFCPSYQILYA